jgi:hypothetical protein
MAPLQTFTIVPGAEYADGVLQLPLWLDRCRVGCLQNSWVFARQVALLFTSPMQSLPLALARIDRFPSLDLHYDRVDAAHHSSVV